MLAARLLGRHVLDGANDLSDDGCRDARDVVAIVERRAGARWAARCRAGIEPTRDVERAMPKSMMIACVVASIITLAGLRSRWTTPAS